MPAVRPVTPEERERIIEALRGGTSLHAVAKSTGRGKGTIHRIAVDAGVERSSVTKAAAAARRDYCQSERLALMNEGFDKARELLAGLSGAQSLAQWATAVAILTDKRRLEDGEATSRQEVSSVGARDRLASRLDELSQRRATKDVA